MRGILISLLAIGLFFLSTTAEGSDWELVTRSKDGNVSEYVDTESIKYISKSIVRAWIKQVLKKPKPYKSKLITHRLGYEEHYCNEGKYIVLELFVYYMDGTLDRDSEENQPAIYIVPDSIASFIHEYLCQGKK